MLRGLYNIAGSPVRVSLRYKLIIYGSIEPHSSLIVHMISWNHTPIPYGADMAVAAPSLTQC